MAGKPKNSIRFTATWIDNVSSNGRTFFTDSEVPALKLRVDGTGRRFLTWGRPAGQNVVRHFVLPVTEHDGAHLEQARAVARQYQDWLRRGVDPRQAETASPDPTLSELLTVYRAHQEADQRAQATLRRIDDLRSYLARHAPALLDAPATSLSRGQIVRFLDAVQASTIREGTATRNTLLRTLRAFLTWAREREYIRRDHEQELRDIRSTRPRQASGPRPLDADQIGALVRALHDHDTVLSDLFEFIAITGLRLSEVRLLPADAVDWDHGRIVLPPEIRKTRFAHHVPLTPWAVDILSRQRAVRERDDRALVFASPGHISTPVSATQSAPRARLTREAGRDDLWTDTGTPAWSPQTLRQTVATHLGRLGFDGETRELVLGHGAAGIQRFYCDPNAAHDRKLAALERWQNELVRLAGLDKPAQLDRIV